ncbi:MAG: cytochrome c oxidase assembly protein [Acidobacteriaceae bacterium]|nr:cytochrome c oxidase assembly protein [Acidobacteriaceae bacterium]
MNAVANAALRSWNVNAGSVAILLIIGFVYVRGWLRGGRLARDTQDAERMAAFLSGLAVVFLANESPLDVFDRLFLWAHMTQHLMLMMIAPPLVLLGHPVLPLLRGLPRQFVKEGLGPFLAWPVLRRLFRWLTSPPLAWIAFAVSTILWHLPFFYELALRSPRWHEAQHASFFWTGILFWWPVIRPGPGRPRWPEWTGIPYLVFADVLNTALSAFLIFCGRVLYPSYESVRGGGMSAHDDQALAGAIMWVPGSVIYLVPAVAMVMRLVSGSRAVRPLPAIVKRRVRVGQRSLLVRLRAPQLRRVAQCVMLVLALAVMADGFFGAQVTPINLAGVLPWIHWRALSLIALLVVGNLFCMACPFTLVRDFGRRVLPAKLRWPRALRNKWIAIALLAFYLWAYEAFSLWDSPWLTAWIMAGYFAAAVVIDGLFRGASFCKYVCPIGQFHFVASLMSPREVGVTSRRVCESCRTYDCIRGNDRTRGCELLLFQPKKAGNIDCTFCLDCVKACPHENVSLVSVTPGAPLMADPYRSSVGRFSRRTDLAVLAALIVIGAFINAVGMVDPVMMWEHMHMVPATIAALVIAGLVIAPALTTSMARRFTFALVPIGIAMWAAHLLYHFATSWGASMSSWLTSLQLLILDAGLLLTLYVCWRIVKETGALLRRALGVMLPWAALSCALYVAGVWILFQPMQMRGMMH